ncbi:hypothetical protein SBX64_06595 [Vibrio rhizosphaerae]|uniref:DUF4129 domain-containing protein n=1 Tax=Vibrio rhizosphaerae TaxID=398736 RepID=A0ABU4IS26_9VIBR|nr:hypothetical protein [Vibrio rhizosphaerae]MDW6092212.1 hypothetical protein [Vibrio rhizosphaerae]
MISVRLFGSFIPVITPQKKQDPAFAGRFPMENKWHRRSFQRLKRAYIDARYSEHDEISAEELTYLQSEVDKLREMTERVCRGRIAP